MKKTLIFCLLSINLNGYSQLAIPSTESAFINPANFPTIPGDAMVKSRTNYYRVLDYTFTRKPDGSLYKNEGSWGSTQVDSNGNLVLFLNRYNHPTNGSYYQSPTMKPWNLESQPEFQNGFFRLYSNLIITPNNPTPSTTSSDLKTLKRNITDVGFPYFNSYEPIGDDTVYNWQSWLYPIYSGARNVDPKTANDQRYAFVKSGTTQFYRDYNYVSLRDADSTNDTISNAGDRNFELDLSSNPATPTNIYARINNLRDKMILSIWYGHRPMAGTASKAMSDLRINGWDSAYDMKYKLWFNGIAAVAPSSSSNEYNKIRAANIIAQGINDENGGLGADLRAFNVKFDEISDVAEDVISGSTEAAMEIKGVRNIAYNYDIDNYGETSKTLQLKMRMLSVGMHFDESKIQQRVFNTTFTTSERIFNPAGSGYNAFKDTFNGRGINFFHPNHPFGLTDEHYIDIISTRPAISFKSTDDSTSSYLGTTKEMYAGDTTALTILDLNVIESPMSQLPFEELTASPAMSTIDTSRIRVSLVEKSVYDAAVADGSIATNNDLQTISGFAFLTQSELVSLQSTIPAGEYVLKYDYSSPDSKDTIKTEGATLGEIFAKSIYRPLIVSIPLPITLLNFDANYKDGIVALNWEIAAQDELNHFEVNRSNDGLNFDKIAVVEANNNSLEYAHYDDQPKNGINYYQLKIVENDNSTSLSSIRKVNAEIIAGIMIFPNPAKDYVIIKNANNKLIEIFDVATARLVKTVIGYSDNTKLQISDLAKGNYIIKVGDQSLKLTIL